jgi:hypothetical protein
MTLLTQKEVKDYLSIVDKVPAAERMKITAPVSYTHLRAHET